MEKFFFKLFIYLRLYHNKRLIDNKRFSRAVILARATRDSITPFHSVPE